MPPSKKSNDVLEEQIKMLFKMLEENKKDYLSIFTEIKQMLSEIKSDAITKDQLKSALELHEAKSVARHEEIERDVMRIKSTLWWVVTTLITTILGIVSAIIVGVVNNFFIK